MKTYRFYYFKCSYTSEVYIKANSLEEAEKKFRELKGDVLILSVECVKE